MVHVLKLYDYYEPFLFYRVERVERVVNNERMDSTLDEYDTYV